jgi:hypothetical protein
LSITSSGPPGVGPVADTGASARTSSLSVLSAPNGSASRFDPGTYHPSSDSDVGSHLAQRFREAVANPSAATMSALRRATVAHATAIRAVGSTPEHDLLVLKAALRGRGDPGWAPSLAEERSSASAAREAPVYEQLFGWWVSAYYG